MMRNSIPCVGIIRIRCKGFDLSLSFIPPWRKRHPYWYFGGKGNGFSNSLSKNICLCSAGFPATRVVSKNKQFKVLPRSKPQVVDDTWVLLVK